MWLRLSRRDARGIKSVGRIEVNRSSYCFQRQRAGKKIKELMTSTVDLGGNSGETNLVKALTPLFDMQFRKLEILVFEGVNPYGWLHQVEQYFVNRLSELEKLDATLLCLDGVALHWHNCAERQRRIESWVEF